MKALLIAEKPSFMKEVQEVYKKHGFKDQLDFVAFRGHTMELQEAKKYNPDWEKWSLNTLPMIPEPFIFEAKKEKITMYKDIKTKIKEGKYDYIINACDIGREGQLIFFSFYESLKINLPVKRLWPNDTTEQEILRALNQLRDESEKYLSNLTIASKYRAYFDWLVGINSTRAITVKNNKKINVGRVMTPILKILADRELEIKNFISKPFFEIEATFDDYKGIYFNPGVKNEQGKSETRFFTKQEAENILSILSKQATVIEVKNKTETKYPATLHSLQELSNEANRSFGYTMAQTLEIAQSLYEKKVISYPRTDCSYLTRATAEQFPKMLKAATYFSDLTPEITAISPTKIQEVINNKKYVDDSAVSDHYALVPTGEIPTNLTENEINIFYLISKRLVALFLEPFIINKTQIITKNNGHLFATNGKVLVQAGFTKIYRMNTTDVLLPNIEEGQTVSYTNGELIEKKTTPSARYNDETLGKAMENVGKFVEDKELVTVLKEAQGIGTPATRGGILEKLVKLEMIKREKKNIHVTGFGLEIIKYLDGNIITLPELTATWEQKLRDIEKGLYDPQQFYKEMIEFVSNYINDFKQSTTAAIHVSTEKESLGQCLKCKSELKETAKFYMCTKYKNGCDFIVGKEIFGAKISKTEFKKILAGKTTKELSFTWPSGKVGPAKVKWGNNKIEFVFNNKK